MALVGHIRVLVVSVVVSSLVVACGGSPPPGPTPTTPAAEAGRESPKKIDLELTDAPIFDALVELAAKAGINLSLHPDVTGTVTIKVHATPWDEVLDRIAKQHALKVYRTNLPSYVVQNASTPPPVTTFTGAKIEIHFDATPIRAVAKEFAEFAKITITVDEDVQVDVTQHLRNLPWDGALDHIVRKYSLRMSRSDNEIRISRAPQTTATPPPS